MMKNRRSYKCISRVAMAGLLTGLGVYTHAGDLSLQDNEVVITGAGASAGFSSTPTIGADGIVGNVTGVPIIDNFGIPSFSFTLLKSEDLTDGDYSFRVAVTFQDNDSDRRMEAMIPELILAVSGGGNTIQGGVPSGQSMRLLGQDDSGTAVVLANISNDSDNGPVTVTDGTITINAMELLEAIASKHPAFTTILDRFNHGAHYTYRIVVQQHSSGQPEMIGFGTGHPVVTKFPKVRTTCDLSPASESGSVFILNPDTEGEPGELAQHFTEAYAVQGQFSVVGSSGAFDTLTAFTDTCTTTGGGDPDPEPEPEPEPEVDVGAGTDDLNDALDDIIIDPNEVPDDSQIDAIEGAIDDAADLLADALDQIDSISTEDALELLGTTGDALSLAGQASEAGGDIDEEAMTDAINNVSSLLEALGDKEGELTQAEIDQVSDIAESTLAASADLISDDSTPDEIQNLVDATASVLNAAIEAGAPLSDAMIDAAVDVATKAIENTISDLATTLGLDPATPVSELMENPSILVRALQNSISVRSDSDIDESGANAKLDNLGVSVSSVARILGSLKGNGAFSNPNVNVKGLSATASLLNALQGAFGAALVQGQLVEGGLNFFSATEALSVTTDALTGALRVGNSTESYAATSTAVRLVPSIVPNGVTYLPDGRAVAVSNGVAVELSGAAADVLSFAAAVEKAGFSTTFRNNGSVELSLGSSQRFSGVFAFENIAGKSGQCGAVSFTAPTGAPTAPGYAFTMTCANGITQHILPFVDSDVFYTTVSKAGLTTTTDRSTGFVNVNGVGRFKPSFFVTPLATADQLYLTQFKNADGVAFRAKDANGDGKMDYEFITSAGVQVLYGVK
ncbi:MAG: hypothetical protein V4751_00970 [Pseudomonadota bacterium]